jgi:quinol-cytochrome oxidoreductase complex cytochrome b subunit
MIGLLLLLATLLLSFSGYLLPWDQLAFWAVTVGANIAASFREFTDALGVTEVMDVGGLVKGMLLGGETVGQDALNRFYLLHVVLLPLLTAVLVAVHIWRIRKDGGLSRPDDDASAVRAAQESPASRSTDPSLLSWPVAFWAEISVLLLCTAAVLLSALLVDAPLRDIADPAMPENPMKAPWYFLGVQELVSYSAFAGGIIIPALLMLGLALIPILDREGTTFGHWFGGEDGRRWFTRTLVFSVVVTGGIILLGATMGWVRDWIPGTPALLNMAVNQGSVMVVLYVMWCRYAYGRSGSTRITAIALFTCAMVGVILFTIVGVWLRGADWRFML